MSNPHCDQLRSLHRPGAPLVLPNAWDVASARAVVAAGFPVVATTSAGVAAALGYEDHEGGPAEEMLAAAARIARGVDVPVTVDAEAGYGLEPEALVAALREAGAAGCNLEDTDHGSGALRDPSEHAAWLSSVREAASNQGFPLVINARIDVFLPTIRTASPEGSQRELLDEGLGRARAYLEAGADCAFPIGLWEADAVETFAADAPGPVNILGVARAPSIDELGRLGVARVSCGGRLQHEAMDRFGEALDSLQDGG